MSTPLILRFPGRPPTHNMGRNEHWSNRMRMVHQYRGDACFLARSHAPMNPPVVIEVQPGTKDNRRADTGACFDAVKAAIDGLVDAGIIPDDGPDIVTRLTFHAPCNTGIDQLVIEVREEAHDIPASTDLAS